MLMGTGDRVEQVRTDGDEDIRRVYDNIKCSNGLVVTYLINMDFKHRSFMNCGCDAVLEPMCFTFTDNLQ